MSDKDKNVKVTDSRASSQVESEVSEHSNGHGHAEDEMPESPEGYPPIDFTTFVLSLSTSAAMHMGEIPEAKIEPNLPLARQTIDILGMLDEKTRGNLSGEEERLLQQVLTDLRVRFVRKVSERR